MSGARTAIIVGAGIGGLAAAIALRRAGWQVRVHERSGSPRELGFGVLLAPNALAALDELGIGDAVVRTRAAAGVELRRTNGRVIRRFRHPLGGQTTVALRPELHGALLAAVGRDALCLNSDIVAFEQAANDVTAIGRDGSIDRGEMLIGADGIQSAIRRQLHPDEPAPRPSGYCAVRGVAFGVSEQLGNLSSVGYFDAGLEAATVRAGAGDAVYWYVSLLERDLPLQTRTPAAVVGQLLGQCEPPLRAILSATAAHDMRFDVLWQRDRLSRWGNGRITLLGDAAHPILPYTGQGAAQALEDGVALGLAISHGDGVEPTLREYERVRQRRTNRFIELGPRLARITTTRNPLVQMMRSLTVRLIPEWVVDRSIRSLGKDPHEALRSRPA